MASLVSPQRDRLILLAVYNYRPPAYLDNLAR